MDIKQIVELALLAKASDTDDAAQCKFQISLDPKGDVDLSAVHDSLIQTGASYKPGQGPMARTEGILHARPTQLEDTHELDCFSLGKA
eukprot:2639613-Pyramimonas_sp.AAC.1